MINSSKPCRPWEKDNEGRGGTQGSEECKWFMKSVGSYAGGKGVCENGGGGEKRPVTFLRTRSDIRITFCQRNERL